MFREAYTEFMAKNPSPTKIEEGVFFIEQIKSNSVERKEIILTVSEIHKIGYNSAKTRVTRKISSARRAGYKFSGKPIKGGSIMLEEKIDDSNEVQVENQEQAEGQVEFLPLEEKNNSMAFEMGDRQLTTVELAEKIRFYAEQIRDNIIVIGKCLLQVHDQVGHGKWGKWIKENTTFSRQTVHKFMECAKRFESVAPAQHLNSSQMIELLSLPESQTEEFLENKVKEGTPVEGMTKSKLRSEIKEWKRIRNEEKNVDGNLEDIKSNEDNETSGDLEEELSTTDLSVDFETIELKVLRQDEPELKRLLKKLLDMENTLSAESKNSLQKKIEELSS